MATSDPPLRTAVYIDGFNFYYGALKGGPHKWLDLRRFAELSLLPRNQIVSIKYFTAHVGDHGDPGAPNRQKAYLRGLKKFRPEIEIIYGQFQSHTKSMPLAKIGWFKKLIWKGKCRYIRWRCQVSNTTYMRPGLRLKTVRVIKTDEKGSDVNLAVHLLNDAWLDVYDCAVVISNDGDLAEALYLVKEHLPNKIIGIILPLLNPKRRASQELVNESDFQKEVLEQHLAAAQLPSPIPGSNIHKPADW